MMLNHFDLEIPPSFPLLRISCGVLPRCKRRWNIPNVPMAEQQFPCHSFKPWKSNVVFFFVGQLAAPLTTMHNLQSMLQQQERAQPPPSCGAPHRAQAEMKLYLLE